MTHVYQEVEKKKKPRQKDRAWRTRPLTTPRTKKHFASLMLTLLSRQMAQDGGTTRDSPNAAGYLGRFCGQAPRSSKKKRPSCGLGLSQEIDTSMAMRAMWWSFGGAEQDGQGM